MAFKKFRKMKVYEASGYNYKRTPSIILKGDWLKETGFDIGGLIQVECENGKLIITPREVQCGWVASWRLSEPYEWLCHWQTERLDECQRYQGT